MCSPHGDALSPSSVQLCMSFKKIFSLVVNGYRYWCLSHPGHTSPLSMPYSYQLMWYAVPSEPDCILYRIIILRDCAPCVSSVCAPTAAQLLALFSTLGLAFTEFLVHPVAVNHARCCLGVTTALCGCVCVHICFSWYSKGNSVAEPSN